MNQITKGEVNRLTFWGVILLLLLGCLHLMVAFVQMLAKRRR